jgi:hypothetical protein
MHVYDYVSILHSLKMVIAYATGPCQLFHIIVYMYIVISQKNISQYYYYAIQVYIYFHGNYQTRLVQLPALVLVW